MGLSSSNLDDSAIKDDWGAIDERLEMRKFYHGLARSLEGGTSTRPGIPVELVIHILRLADCTLRLTVASGGSVRITGAGAARRLSWISAPPLKRDFVKRGLRLQLTTESRDQGFCDDPRAGSWSWFEIAVASTSDEMPVVKRREDGSALVWTSHHNPIAHRAWSTLEGPVFDENHEIWQHLDEGDILQVQVCAQYIGWQNNVREGVLHIMELFEPTLPPRRLD